MLKTHHTSHEDLEESVMSLENWVISLSKCKRIIIRIADRWLARTTLEPIEGEEGIVGVKAVWTGERGEGALKVNAQSWKGHIKTQGDTPPTVEYWQQGDKRGFALRNPKSLLCEIDQKTLSQLATARNAGIATITGAAIGFVGWLAVAVASKLTLVKRGAEGSSPPLLEYQKTSAESPNEGQS